MRVLVLTNNATGLICFRMELLERLISLGHEVYVDVPQDNRTHELVSCGINVIYCKRLSRHGTNPFLDTLLLVHYLYVIKTLSPDIVFTYTIKPNVYGGIACSLNRVPYVSNITGLGSAVEKGGLLQMITLSLYRIGLRNAKRVFFQNSSNLAFMQDRGVISTPAALLPGSGVNLKRFSPLPYPEDDEVRFVFISRVMREKGIEEFLDAASYIVDKYSRVQFHVYGGREPEYEGRLDECVQQGVVIYHGQVDDIPAVHALSSCTVHPSFYPEGMSNVLLESCACARPIITTNRPGCKEIVRDGENGFLIRERDSDDLIRKIECFLGLSVEERRKMGLMGRELVEKEFNREIVIQKYLNEVDSIL